MSATDAATVVVGTGPAFHTDRDTARALTTWFLRAREDWHTWPEVDEK